MMLVCRYISENFGGIALHPVDVMDAGTGRLVAEMKDPNLQTICPVNKPHPRQDIIISGSSSSLYAWSPASPGDFLACLVLMGPDILKPPPPPPPHPPFVLHS